METGQIIFQGQTPKGLPIVVRYPKAEDVDIMRQYINTLSQEHTFISFQGETLSLEEEQKYVTSFLEKMEKHLAIKLLAFTDDKLVGMVDVTMKERIEKHIGLLGLTVAKEYRQQGVGRLLLSKVVEESTISLPQLEIIVLCVFENNPIAYRLYQSVGFQEYGKLSQGIKLPDGSYVTHIEMYKKINR